MSVESLAIALHHSRAKGAALLILIGIANHDGDGGAWPALATLMRYARVTDRRGAQRMLRQLEQLNEIKCLVSQGGDHSVSDYLKPNLYRFILECPQDCDRSKNHRTRNREALQIELDPAVSAPPPRQDVLTRGAQTTRGADTAGTRGADTALTITRTIKGEQYLTEPKRAVDNSELQRLRTISDQCPGRRPGNAHVFPSDSRYCDWCGLEKPEKSEVQ